MYAVNKTPSTTRTKVFLLNHRHTQAQGMFRLWLSIFSFASWYNLCNSFLTDRRKRNTRLLKFWVYDTKFIVPFRQMHSFKVIYQPTNRQWTWIPFSTVLGFLCWKFKVNLLLPPQLWNISTSTATNKIFRNMHFFIENTGLYWMIVTVLGNFFVKQGTKLRDLTVININF